MSFPTFVNMAENTLFFPVLQVFEHQNDVRAYIVWSWKTTLITWSFFFFFFFFPRMISNFKYKFPHPRSPVLWSSLAWDVTHEHVCLWGYFNPTFTYHWKPRVVIWLIWAIVCHYTDKKTHFHTFLSHFVRVLTHYGSNESNDSLRFFCVYVRFIPSFFILVPKPLDLYVVGLYNIGPLVYKTTKKKKKKKKKNSHTKNKNKNKNRGELQMIWPLQAYSEYAVSHVPGVLLWFDSTRHHNVFSHSELLRK